MNARQAGCGDSLATGFTAGRNGIVERFAGIISPFWAKDSGCFYQVANCLMLTTLMILRSKTFQT